MLIHPWDRGARRESLDFLRAQGFGQLVASGRGRDTAVVVPTQFLVADDDTVLLHLARPNPVWEAIAENPTVLLCATGDWAYVPSQWNEVPTTYYAAVQLTCEATVLDDPAEKTEVLRRQLGVLEQDAEDYDFAAQHRLLPGLRALHLSVREVTGKFKYGGNQDADYRRRISTELATRNAPGDAAARCQLERRLAAERPAERPADGLAGQLAAGRPLFGGAGRQ
ncbi:FMN-binding negative transcriptional regulator [Kitasatospora phosalacinea]|uniref:FMN-binding negative transcriptional regulator n=1 Tax=Kitasatospora phosalacinea TaxID=2065 RepID=UPI003657B4F7